MEPLTYMMFMMIWTSCGLPETPIPTKSYLKPSQASQYIQAVYAWAAFKEDHRQWV